MPTFADLSRREPRLLEIEAAVKKAAADGLCWIATWEDVAKPMMRPIVGMYRRPFDDLSDSYSWDCVLNYFLKGFPACKLRCPGCGLPVPESETFTGVHPDSNKPLGTVHGAYRAGLRNSWLAVVDMLGFSRSVMDAESDGLPKQHLDQLKRVLNNAYRYLRADDDASRPWALKLYSDNAVVGVEVWDDGESESGRIFNSLSYFQLAAIFNGQFIRGGLSIGNAYIDQDIVYGKAVIDAHAMEEVAEVPRIVLAQPARLLLAHHATYYDRKALDWFAWQPIIEDVDGHWFVDYLHVISGTKSYARLDAAAMARHRDIVTRALEEHRGNDHVLSKYRWVAGYHNLVCRQIAAPELAVESSGATFPEPCRDIPVRSRKAALRAFRARHPDAVWPEAKEVVAIANSPKAPRRSKLRQ